MKPAKGSGSTVSDEFNFFDKEALELAVPIITTAEFIRREGKNLGLDNKWKGLLEKPEQWNDQPQSVQGRFWGLGQDWSK